MTVSAVTVIQRRGSRQSLFEGREHHGGKSPVRRLASRPISVGRRSWAVASLSPVADMPLAFLVERAGVACLVDLWRIELQCALPCKPSSSVFRCAAGALDRNTGQAGLGKWGDGPRFTPNSPSYSVRFRFAAGVSKAGGGTGPLSINYQIFLADVRPFKGSRTCHRNFAASSQSCQSASSRGRD